MSRILVVDDNELISKMLEHSLSEQGYNVRTALDANQGYAAAIEFHPDLILLDVQLPDVAGFELCRVIKNRAELHEVPIIMITGTARSTDEKVKGFQMGVDDYVLKPFEMSELVERIKAILRRSEAGRAQAEHAIPLRGDPAPPSEAQEPPRLSIRQAIAAVLLAPSEFPANAPCPGVATLYLAAALGLLLGALAVAAGPAVKPALAGVSLVGGWGILVSALVMACSLLGIPLGWKEGARLMSLAGLPLLLKLAGAFASSLWTTLSPFYFTAGPSLLWISAPAWAIRLDLFELWSVFLVGVLVAKRPGSSSRKARLVALIVWAAGAALAMGLGKLGNP